MRHPRNPRTTASNLEKQSHGQTDIAGYFSFARNSGGRRRFRLRTHCQIYDRARGQQTSWRAG